MNPSAILTADWHIRATSPLCRTDEFFRALVGKVIFILSLSNKYNCPILVAGDIGDKAQWPNWLLEWFIRTINKAEVDIIAIPGQHDLPYHRLDILERSGLGVLHATEAIDVRSSTFVTIEKDFNLITFPYSMPIDHFKINRETGNYPKIAMTHQMVIEDKPLWPGQIDPKGAQLLKKFPEYDLILSGDNHIPFTCEHKGRLLVNPGSMMRTQASQVNHKPRVYLWWAGKNKIKEIFLPIEKGVVSREHIEKEEDKDKRIEAYTERMKLDYEVGFSFEDNLRKHIEINDVRQEVIDKIWKVVE
jgi:DNA repair exonuclease SbcCD nuclease subunit